MPAPTIHEAKILILNYLEASYQRGGWGRLAHTNPSVTNTTEALLILEQWDSLDHKIIHDHKSEIISFLETKLRHSIEDSMHPSTRDVAYSILGLYLLGQHTIEELPVDTLLKMANSHGGWPLKEGEENSLLVPTFHAMSVLNRLQISVPDIHLDWLLSLQKTNELCVFAPDNNETRFGASALTLYLLSKSKYADKAKVKSLADNVCQKLHSFFSSMQGEKSEWACYDDNSSFTIFGYGHALAALSEMGFDLTNCDINTFLKKCMCCVSKEPDSGQQLICSFDTRVTWIPAALEFTIALQAIRRNFDPLRYMQSLNKKIMEAGSQEIREDKERIEAEKVKLQYRQLVIDELERNVIRQRAEIQQLLAEIKKATSDSARPYIEMYLREVKTELLRSIVFWVCCGALFLLGAIPTAIKIAQGTFNISEYQSALGIALSSVSLIIVLVSWRVRSAEDAIRRKQKS